MMLGARTAAWSGKSLPYDAEVEYIKSDGVAYIRTGIICNADTRFRAVAKPLRLTQWPVGCVSKDYVFFGIQNQWDGYINVYHKANYPLISYIDDYFDADEVTHPGEIWINGSYKYTLPSITYDFTDELYLMAYNYETFGPRGFYTSEVKLIQVSSTGGILGDFIPVRVGTEGCFYDRVSGRIFRNAGTGAFVIGPDK